jgi:hypothetical protein
MHAASLRAMGRRPARGHPTTPQRGERRYDCAGMLTLLAAADGYVMVRRPRRKPFVLDLKDWRMLRESTVAADDRTAPRAMFYGVLP